MSEALHGELRAVQKRRFDQVALAVLIFGLITLALGLLMMALGAGLGAWFGLFGFVLTFGVLAYAIYVRL